MLDIVGAIRSLSWGCGTYEDTSGQQKALATLLGWQYEGASTDRDMQTSSFYTTATVGKWFKWHEMNLCVPVVPSFSTNASLAALFFGTEGRQ